MGVIVAEFAVKVALSPLSHIDRKHAGIDEGTAERLVGLGRGDRLLEAFDKVAPNGLRDVAGSCRIDICEQNKFSKKHLPVRIRQLSEAVPVQRASAGLE